MMRDTLGLVAALIIAASAVFYLVAVLHGQTRPQRTSWAVWAVVGVLGFGATSGGGAGPGAWATGVDAVACVVTFAVSLHPRYGKRGFSVVDPALLVVGVTATVFWRFGMLSMTWAALCAVGCELVALWPTLREAWRQPHSESIISWGADLVAEALALAAVATTSVAAFAVPVYALGASGAVVLVLAVRRAQIGTSAAPPVLPMPADVMPAPPLSAV